MNNEVQLFWLRRLFERKLDVIDWILPTEEEAVMRARGYILHMLGEFWFPSTTGNKVNLEYLLLLENLHHMTQYSWGLTILSYLYNDLCRVIENGRMNDSGSVVLL